MGSVMNPGLRVPLPQTWSSRFFSLPSHTPPPCVWLGPQDSGNGSRWVGELG